MCWFAACEICVQSVDTARTDAPLATSLRASQRRGLSGTSSTRDWARASVWASVRYVHVYDWPYCKNHKKWPVPEHWGSATHYDGIIKERRWSVKGVVFSGLSNEPIYIPVVVAIFFFRLGGGLRYKYVNVCLPPIHRKGTGTLSVAEHAVVWCKGLVRSWRRGGS